MTEVDWKLRYADKIATAAEAVKLIHRGRRILIGSGAGEPTSLVEALSLIHISEPTRPD